MTDALQTKLDEAIALHQAGDHDAAEVIYREILKKQPNHCDALHLLGHVCMLKDDLEAAESNVRASLRVDPRFPYALHTLALICQRKHAYDEAEKHLRKALNVNEEFDGARIQLARNYVMQGRFAEAEKHFSQLAKRLPEDLTLLFEYASVLVQLKKYDPAEAVYKAILGKDSQFIDALNNYAVLLIEQERNEEALPILQRVMELNPENYMAACNLGLVYENLGRFPEAIASYKQSHSICKTYPASLFNLGNVYLKQGDRTAALNLFKQVVDQFPDYYYAHNALGKIYFEDKHFEEAERIFKQSVEIEPLDNYAAYSTLGLLYRTLQRFDDSEAMVRKSIEANPTAADPHNTLGWVLSDSARYAEAEQVFRDGLAKEPSDRNIHSNLLMLLTYSRELRHKELYEAHLQYGRQHRVKDIDQLPPLEVQLKPYKKLRIGYISPDFRRHVVRNFIQPIIQHHNRDKVEVFCYANVEKPDDITEIIFNYTDHWLNIWNMDPLSVAKRIREDKIDVLIELAGHSAQNRLDVCSYKPAPVQVSYLGYITTTGVPEFDYRITDWIMNPADTQELYSEELYRLDRCYKTYEAAPHEPPVNLSVSPAGKVIFGSLHRISKLSPRTVELWSRVLQALPESKLMLARHELHFKENQALMIRLFGEHGIAADRLILDDTHPYETHMEIYGKIDIGLDPVPVVGGATTSEALWMGVPVITLQGEAFRERISSTLLDAMGLNELIATSPDDFVAKAVAFANDYHKRLALRSTMRDRFLKSPLGDSKGLATALEDAYLDMWHRYIEKCIHANPTD